MKIAFVNDGIFAYASKDAAAVGGAERQQWYLARALAATNWKVVVGVRHALRARERRPIQGVEFVGIDRGPFLFDWRRFVAAERPDWWYWRGANHLYGPMVGIARAAGVRSVFSVAFDSDVHPQRALSWRPRWWPLYALGLAWSDRILVQHAGQMNALPERWRLKARLIRSIASSATTVSPHSERPQYVAWVAMLRKPKRPDLLVDIARRLPGVHFVVCGGSSTHRTPGGYSEEIIHTLRTLPNVTFLGQVSPQKASEVVRDAAVLLSTSDEEGFPNTFLEAWSNGTPVVTLKVDPDGVVEQHGLGVVGGTMDRTAAAIEELVTSPQIRSEISRRALQHIEYFHGERSVVTEFERALQSVCKTSSAGSSLGC
jgi:glycosyltransferase involved in cell wall biosynthesis